MWKSKFYVLKQQYSRWLTWTILLISIAVIVSGCGGSSAPIPSRPSTVQAARDAKGVWFITGSEQDRIYDVFEAMGYAVATDRLWQLETYRRVARGRLAEIAGSSQLASDQFMRTTGYSDQELENGFASMDAESQDVIKGYVAGCNRRIAEIRKNPSLLPFEFSVIGITSITLEDWTYKDILAWMSVICKNFDSEGYETGQISNAALYQGLVAAYGAEQGVRMFEDLRWINDPDALTYIPKPLSASSVQGSTKKIRSLLLENPPSFPDMREVAKSMEETKSMIQENLKKINAYVKMGSYAWAVKGSKTSSGNPILVSGPQMGVSVPSVVSEISIRAAGLNISGMMCAGIPFPIVGRTPHHSWSTQVGQSHTVDYYMESASAITLNRTDTIKVRGGDDVILPIYRTAHGPVISTNPVISWKYSQWGVYEFNMIKACLTLARATSMDQFGAGMELMPISLHFLYADRDGNIAYWMAGRDPVRPYGEWRLPQGAAGTALEWDSANLVPRSTDRNTSQGFYGGWNNKSSASYPNYWNGVKNFGPFHRAHVVVDYLSANNNLTFEQVRDIELNIATTDSWNLGGNPWKFVSEYFIAAVNADPNPDRLAALAILAQWDGHFVDGGVGSWATGTNRADAWMLMDAWIKGVLDLTFEELNAFPTAKDNVVLFNVLLHGLRPGGLKNSYDWFQNSTPGTPQTANAIIVKALDNTLTTLGARPWGTNKRTVIAFNHDILGKVWEMPFSSRSSYTQIVEYGLSGPVKIQSMFPLGESGNILVGTGGAPVFDDNFFSMTSVFDGFVYRDFPLFTP